MANLEKIKNRLEALKAGKRFAQRENDNFFWKPKKDGAKSQVRLIHYPFSEEDPFIELYFNYNIGDGGGFLSLKMLGKPDPVNDFAKTLWNSEDPKDKELAKQLFPRQRFYAVVVDREDPSLTPKYWSFGIQIYEKLLAALLDNDTKHFLNPEKGIDLEVWVTKTAGKKYPNTECNFKRNDSALASSPEEIAKIIGKVTPISEIIKPLTTAEVRKRLDGWLNGGSSSSEPEEFSKETTRGNANVSDSDVDADFEKAVQNANLD